MVNAMKPSPVLKPQVTYKVKDVRHQRNLDEFLPDQCDEYRDEMLEILERIDTGYWPTIDVKKGWYALLVKLNAELRNVCTNYKIVSLKRENNEMQMLIRVPKAEEDKLKELVGFIAYAKVRSRSICEQCGGVKSSDVTPICDDCAPISRPRKRTKNATTTTRRTSSARNKDTG
jgi:hypothetical protein